MLDDLHNRVDINLALEQSMPINSLLIKAQGAKCRLAQPVDMSFGLARDWTVLRMASDVELWIPGYRIRHDPLQFHCTVSILETNWLLWSQSLVPFRAVLGEGRESKL